MGADAGKCRLHNQKLRWAGLLTGIIIFPFSELGQKEDYIQRTDTFKQH